MPRATISKFSMTNEDRLLDAVRSGNAEEVRELLARGANPAGCYSAKYNIGEARKKRNAAHYNAMEGNREITDLLMRPETGLHEAGMALALSHDAEGKTPVHLAFEYSHLPIAQVHMQYDSFDAWPNTGRDGSGNYPVDYNRTPKAKALWEEHRPKNRVGYDAAPVVEQVMAAGGMTILNGKDAANFHNKWSRSRLIEQPTKVFSAMQGWVDNAAYERSARGAERSR